MGEVRQDGRAQGTAAGRSGLVVCPRRGCPQDGLQARAHRRLEIEDEVRRQAEHRLQARAPVQGLRQRREEGVAAAREVRPHQAGAERHPQGKGHHPEREIIARQGRVPHLEEFRKAGGAGGGQRAAGGAGEARETGKAGGGPREGASGSRGEARPGSGESRAPAGVMIMSELDEIRKRKLEQLRRLQSAQGQQSPGEDNLAQQIAQLESMVKPAFTREALERYGTIKTAFPEKAVQVLVVLAQFIQSGKVKHVDDDLLKKLLTQLTPKKRETQIRGI